MRTGRPQLLKTHKKEVIFIKVNLRLLIKGLGFMSCSKDKVGKLKKKEMKIPIERRARLKYICDRRSQGLSM